MLNFARSEFADQALRATAVAAAICTVVLLTVVPLSSNDFWLQVTIGGMIWNSGEIPDTVLFAFTEAQDYPFHAHEWLASIVFYLLHEALGYDQLIWVKGALGIALFALCCRLAHRLTSSLPVSLFLAIVTMAVANYRHFMRPEIFAYLFLLILLNLLAEYQLTRRRQFLAWIVPLALVWANSHGSFPIALVIVACIGAGEGITAAFAAKGAPGRASLRAAILAARPYFICCAATFLATLVNPYGYQLYLFAWDFAQWAVTREYIIEWGGTFSPGFARARGFWAYLGLLALCLTVVIACHRKLRAADVLLLFAFGYLSTDRQRHVVLFAFVSLYVLARVIGPVAIGPRATRGALALLLVLLLAGGGMLLRYGNLQGEHPYSVSSRKFTPLLIEYVENRDLRGNVFNSFELGAELVHKFYPRLRPAIDSRIDAYGERYFEYYSQLYSDERLLLDFIAHYDVRYMLLLWWEFERIKQMPQLPLTGWRMLFADHKMVLLGRGDRVAPQSR
jgi:hypothetical protein